MSVFMVVCNRFPVADLGPEKQKARLFDGPFLNARTELLFVLGTFFVGVFRCFVSLYGVIESTLAVFHSLGMITFTMVLGSGAMCLGRIVMMLGGFKVCIFWHIHSPCPRTRTHQLMIPALGVVYFMPKSIPLLGVRLIWFNLDIRLLAIAGPPFARTGRNIFRGVRINVHPVPLALDKDPGRNWNTRLRPE
jgi:hypothetical protein